MADEYNEEYEEEYEEEYANKKGVKILLIIVGLIMIIAGAVYTGYYVYSQLNAQQESQQYTEIQTTKEEVEQKAKNPINFKKLKKQNDEIYAWIKVPGTKVDYPIVQSRKSDMFYLKHSALTKKWAASGAIYTECINSTTFKDRVTLIYGHNGYSDTMFTTLHRFEKKDFFEKHSKFYIYTPHSKLTYRVVSAFKYDNRHIMNSFEFQDNAIYSEFLTMIQNPESMQKNVRKNLDKPLTLDDNIVVLSTCIKNQKSNRYLVCGVLIKDEKTN